MIYLTPITVIEDSAILVATIKRGRGGFESFNWEEIYELSVVE